MIRFITFFSIISSVCTVSKKDIYLFVGGNNIVFEMKTDGLVVTGAYDIIIDGKKYNPFFNGGLCKGDIIYKVDNIQIKSIKEFTDQIKKIDCNKLEVGIKRSNNFIKKEIRIMNYNGLIKTGLFVKERTIGIGTLTFVDSKNSFYGALGHEVYDNDINSIINVDKGSVYLDDVLDISKGINGKPGEKQSKVSLSNCFGDLKINDEFGIFGKIKNNFYTKTKMLMAKKDEVKKGEAFVLTTLDGDRIGKYKININNLVKQNFNQEKGIHFSVTDKYLIDKCGGIFSGMSGSPIIQNNKIIGAVTHVITDDIDSGYGIYIENMYYRGLSKLELTGE